MTAPAASGSSAANGVYARFAEGSVVSAPPELVSQNGVLEVTMKFRAATDAQGLVRYCYVTDSGLEAPTLRVSPGDAANPTSHSAGADPRIRCKPMRVEIKRHRRAPAEPGLLHRTAYCLGPAIL
jgi:hypothetical protein